MRTSPRAAGSQALRTQVRVPDFFTGRKKSARTLQSAPAVSVYLSGGKQTLALRHSEAAMATVGEALGQATTGNPVET